MSGKRDNDLPEVRGGNGTDKAPVKGSAAVLERALQLIGTEDRSEAYQRASTDQDWLCSKDLGLDYAMLGLAEVQVEMLKRISGFMGTLETKVFSEETLEDLTPGQRAGLYNTLFAYWETLSKGLPYVVGRINIDDIKRKIAEMNPASEVDEEAVALAKGGRREFNETVEVLFQQLRQTVNFNSGDAPRVIQGRVIGAEDSYPEGDSAEPFDEESVLLVDGLPGGRGPKNGGNGATSKTALPVEQDRNAKRRGKKKHTKARPVQAVKKIKPFSLGSNGSIK